MTTYLHGKGKGKLDFGNCWSTGFVKLFLNDLEIESAGPGEFKVAMFDYDDNSKLEIQEVDTAIIQINKFELGMYVIFQTIYSHGSSLTYGY